VDGSGNLFIADADGLIRKVSAGGIITTVAGNGTSGFSGDGGPAISASLALPGRFQTSGVAVDASGNLFIADVGNNRVREVTAGGIITTVAGNGTAGFSGDGGAATSASLSKPTSVAVDGSGNLFIADSGNNVIREVSASGIITTIAGNGSGGSSGDGGPATLASLNGFMNLAVAVDAAGNLFIGDVYNGRIREVSGGIINTIAGGGDPDLGIGDGGPATSASLLYPEGIAVDAFGNLFIADWGDNCVREVFQVAAAAPAIKPAGRMGVRLKALAGSTPLHVVITLH
jgi:sugar lactone lactonase YvrE